MNVYDFDKTIYYCDSSKDFYLFCLKRYPSCCLVLPKFAFYALLYKLGKRSKESMKEAFFGFLRFLPDAEMMVSLFWEARFHNVWDWYIKQKANTDVVISASPEFLLKPICSKLGVTLIATIVDSRTGLFTGLNCYGEEKVRRFRDIYPDANIENFYSDSLSDAPMAKLSKNAYMVKKDSVSKWK